MDNINGSFPEKINKEIIDDCLSSDFPINGILDFSHDEEKDFFVEYLKSGYETSRSSLLSIKGIEGSDVESMNNYLSALINSVSKLERANKPELEKECIEKILSVFNVPEDSVDFTVSIEDMFSDDISTIQLSPEDVSLEYDDYKDVKSMKFEIGQRYMNNILVAGIASYFTIKVLGRMVDSGVISETLFKSYIKILTINDFILYQKGKIKFSEKNKNEIGFVNVILGDDEKRTMIESKAKILPVLIYETIKGLFELISTHALPKERRRAGAILKKTDCVETELWYMRLGPVLWEKIRNSIPEMDPRKLPDLFLKIIMLPKMKYIRLMKELIHGTTKSQRIINYLYDDIEYDVFMKDLDSRKNKQNIIQDEYIRLD